MYNLADVRWHVLIDITILDVGKPKAALQVIGHVRNGYYILFHRHVEHVYYV